jgi:putative oxygen-independent coproporphyrinogen III oxidase
VSEAGFGAYIHWPFCRSKCPYCDFNSHVRERIDEARWRRALLAEIDHAAARLAPRRIASVFFGGGTPSLMAPETVAALIERLSLRWTFDEDVEITLEANPTSVEAERFAGFRAAGVNRVSLGVQALDDRALRFLGRGHDAGQARGAVALAARHFPRFSFDLIYARPAQTVEAWRAELGEALALAGDHLSVYQLTIERGTAFAPAHARGDFVLPDEETQGALYEATQEMLTAAGLAAYEISNHARTGSECRHNLVYWRYGDYLGLGPGAHGRLTLEGEKRATRNRRTPEAWLEAVENSGTGLEEETVLGREERRDEILMMGLRLGEGVPRARFWREIGNDVESALDPGRLAKLIEGGFLVLDDQALRATEAGRQRLNAVLAALLA